MNLFLKNERFSTWLHYNRPSVALTADKWVIQDREFKKEAPIRYWIVNVLPYISYKKVQWKIESMYDWVRYRIVRYHVINTGLSPNYYDTDTLMLYANFAILVNYVEVQLAWMTYVESHDNKCKYLAEQSSFLNRLLSKNSTYVNMTFRSRKLGLMNLAWASSLDDPMLPEVGRNPPQAKAAREIRDLYLWWTDVYSNRQEVEFPDDAKIPELDHSLMFALSDEYKKMYPIDYQNKKQWSEQVDKQDKEWKIEEDCQLIRLIKVRHMLWT